MSNYILRRPAVCERLGVGNTVFHEKFVYKDGKEFVPGTHVPRLRSVALGLRSVGYFADEVDALIEGMRACRDVKKTTPVT